jgi:hypothetical protein
MIDNADRSTAKQRRYFREPWKVKFLRKKLNDSVTEMMRNKTHKALLKTKWEFHKSLDDDAKARNVKKEGVIFKKQTLWPITVIKTPAAAGEPVITTAPGDCLSLVAECFNRKWSTMTRTGLLSRQGSAPKQPSSLTQSS